MECALARWPWLQLLGGTRAPTRDSAHLVSGWPSLPERMCKRKTTPPSGWAVFSWTC